MTRRMALARQVQNAFPFDSDDPIKMRQIIATELELVNARIDKVASVARRTVRTLDNPLTDAMRGFVTPTAAVDGEEVAVIAPIILSAQPDKAAAEFEAWFNIAMSRMLLESEDIQQTVILPGVRHFTKSASLAAIQAASIQAHQRAVALGLTGSPELAEFLRNQRSANPVDHIANRQYSLLRQMTFEEGEKIKALLQDGLERKLSTEEIAKNISDRIEHIKTSRARTIVRTELVGAHANATLRAYMRLGVGIVSALMEFSLNVHGDAPPCPLCLSLAGMVYPVAAALDIIPVHPNCQCGWIPLIS